MKRRFLFVLVFVVSLVITVWVNPSLAAPAGPVELRAVTAWPTQVAQNRWFHDFVKEVNEGAKKAGIPLTIKKLGGPEVIGTMQQFASMRSGAVDMVYTSGGYFSGETVELEALGLIRPDPVFFLNAVRETKVMDVVNAACREKSGTIQLLSGLMSGYTLLSNKPVKPGDWRGLKIRNMGKASAIGIAAMGASSVFIPPAEVFDALQRGIIDGVMGAPADRYSFGERGVYKYIIQPAYSGGAGGWFISAKIWDGLPENMKTFLRSASKDMEEACATEHRKWNDDTTVKYMNEDKVKLVWCTPTDERKLAKAFRMDVLESMVKSSPNYGQKIYHLIKDYIY